MATNFPKYRGAQQPQMVQMQQEPEDPEAAALAALQARMNQPRAPLLSPEEVAARRQQNQQEYALGLLGQMSGHQTLAPVGGQLLKQALAARQAKVSERGSTDPLTGEFTYDPDYLAQRDEQTAGGMQQRMAQRAFTRQENRTKAQERADQQREARADRAAAAAEARADRAAMVAAGGGGHPTGDERNAANFASIMQLATTNLDKFESTGTQTNRNQLAGAIPLIGNTIASAAMTPQQQAYAQAAQQWVRAKLRKESGASIGEKEMADEIRTFFPQPEDGPLVRAQKREARALANQGMVVAAGRAQIPTLPQPGGGGGGAPASVDVGALLAAQAPPQRNPMGAGRQALPLSNPQGGGGNKQVKAGW
jgi:hypothetical protein